MKTRAVRIISEIAGHSKNWAVSKAKKAKSISDIISISKKIKGVFIMSLADFLPRPQQDSLSGSLGRIELNKATPSSILKRTGTAETQFFPMLQGVGYNRLAQINTRSAKPVVDEITGIAGLIIGEEFGVFIYDYEKLPSGLRVSMQKLLDATIICFTAQNEYRGKGNVNRFVTIPLADYMALCGVNPTKPSKDQARRQIMQDLKTLQNTKIIWKEKSGWKIKEWSTRLLVAASIKHGRICAELSSDFALYLRGAYITHFPGVLFRIGERDQNAFLVGRKLVLHYGMDANNESGTANKLSVHALLDHCIMTIPRFDDVMDGNRHIDTRIIKPLERALLTLEKNNLIKWGYVTHEGEILTDEQLSRCRAKDFLDFYITFSIIGFPDQSARIAKKKEKKKAYKKSTY